jgi:hypothetical protein
MPTDLISKAGDLSTYLLAQQLELGNAIGILPLLAEKWC